MGSGYFYVRPFEITEGRPFPENLKEMPEGMYVAIPFEAFNEHVKVLQSMGWEFHSVPGEPFVEGEEA